MNRPPGGWMAEPRFMITIMTCAYVAIGATLILQPSRYGATPSYEVLLEIFDQRIWGLVHLLIAAGLGASVILAQWRHGRVLAVISHTAAIALTAAWLGAFVVRWITDDATTIVNVASWSVYLALLIRSTLQLDDLRPVAELRPGIDES